MRQVDLPRRAIIPEMSLDGNFRRADARRYLNAFNNRAIAQVKKDTVIDSRDPFVLFEVGSSGRPFGDTIGVSSNPNHEAILALPFNLIRHMKYARRKATMRPSVDSGFTLEDRFQRKLNRSGIGISSRFIIRHSLRGSRKNAKGSQHLYPSGPKTVNCRSRALPHSWEKRAKLRFFTRDAGGHVTVVVADHGPWLAVFLRDENT